jgi:hypothetical protein
MVIPLTTGIPSVYTIKFVFAKSIYFTQLYLLSKPTNKLPVNIKNKEIPTAKELLRKTVEIINAKVTIISKLTQA